MKLNSRLRLFLLGSPLLAAPLADAAIYYWDDNAAGTNFGTAGVSIGTWAAPTAGPTAGWSLSATGADAFAPFTTATTDTLNFGNGATGLAGGTIAVSGTVDAGDMTFASGSGRIVLSGGTINLAAASTITVNNGSNAISSILQGAGTSLTKAGTGMLTLSGANTYTGATTLSTGTLSVSAANNLGAAGANLVFDGGTLQITGTALTSFTGIGHTVSFNATKTVGLDVNSAFSVNQALDMTSGGGFTKLGTGTATLSLNNTYTGATTISGGGTIALSGAAGRISGTSGITLNNSNISITNLAAEVAVDRLSAGAITSNGGTITWTNTSAASTNYAETIGSVALTSGQLNIFQATNQNALTNTQTLTLGGLSQAGTSVVTFSAATTGPNSTTNIIKNSSIGVATTPGQIIGPWATTGTAANAQTKWAVYDASGNIIPDSIADTSLGLWTNSTTNAWSLNAGSLVTINAITQAAAVRFYGAASSLTLGTGNLETYGLMFTGANAKTVDSTGGALSTPSGGGNLFITTANAGTNTITAPINNNSGNVTLVKSGAGTLSLSSTTSNYSGGTVINGGALNLTADSNLGNTAGDITVNGSATLQGASISLNSGRTVTLNNGAILSFLGNNGTGDYGFTIAGQVTGSGGISMTGGSWNVVTLSATNNDFTGPIRIGAASGGNQAKLTVASLGDSASPITFGGMTGTNNSPYVGNNFIYNGSTALVLNNRWLELTGAGTNAPANIFAEGTGTLTIATDLRVTAAGSKLLTLQGGTSSGNNTFSGKIADGTDVVAAVAVTKAGAGTWILSGNNTYSGGTTLSAGTLNANAANAMGTGNVTVTAGTLVIGAANAIADTAALRLPSAAAKNLTMNASDRVGSLFLAGLQQPNGSYTSAGAGSAWMNTGSGILMVGSAAAQPIFWDLDGAPLGAGSATPTGTWNAGNTVWNALADGTGSVNAWSAGATATFSAGTNATGTYTVTVDGTQDIGGLTFEEGNVTLTGGTALRLVSDSLVHVATGLTATISTPLSQDSARTLTKIGPGTLVLSGTNNYTGATTVGAGTLRLANASAISSVLNVNAGNVVLDNVTTPLTSLNFNTGATNQSITGGTLSMSGGTITRTNKTVGIFDTITSGITGSPNVSFSTSSATDYRGGLQFAPSGNATQALGTISLNQTGGSGDKAGLMIGGVSAGNSITSVTNTSAAYGTFRKRGPGEWTVGSINFGAFQNYAGTTIVRGQIDGTYFGTQVFGGTLVLDYTANNNSLLRDAGSAGVQLYLLGGALQLDRSSGATGSHAEVVFGLTLNGGAAAINRASGSTATLRMNTITRSAGATLNIGAANIASTDTTNANGILGSWATVGGADWAYNSGSTTVGGADASQPAGAADGFIRSYTGYTNVDRLTPGTIADGSTTNVRLMETSGSPGSIALGAATTTINTLNQSASGGTSAATIDTASKTLLVNGILAGAGSGALTIGVNVNDGFLKTANAASGGELIVHNHSSNPMTINSVIANNTASVLIHSGTGTTILAGTNTYSGATRISGGVLQAALGTGLSASTHLLLDGGVLQSSGSFTRANNLTAGGGNFYWSSENGGGFSAKGGKLTVNISNNLTEQTWAWVTDAASTTLATGNNAILGPLKFGSSTADSEVEFRNPINLNGETREIQVTDNIGSGGDFATISGVIRNSSTVVPAGIYKSGTGKLVLTSSHTYNGATTVAAGVLAVNGSLANTTTTIVKSGATLQGTGSIGGSVTVESGATLAPGDSIESLVTGALTMASTSTFGYEVTSNSATGADMLGVNGALTLTGVNLTFDLATSAALSGGGWSDGNKLTLISYIDSGAGITSGFTGYADDTSYLFGSNSWLFNYNDTTAGGNYGTDAVAAGQNKFVTMTVTVIPEPSSVALLGTLGAMLLFRRRR